MAEAARASPTVRFGVFEIDLRAGELRRKGRKLKLQEQPFQVLALLLEHPGEVVTREALREKLWPAGTFVEFDHSLNTAISKIREALGDLADNPRFVETLPRRGYRFIAPVESLEAQAAGITPRHPSPALGIKVPAGSVRLTWWRARGRVAVVALGVVLAGLLAVWLMAPLLPPKVVRSVQITNTGRVAFNTGTAAFLPALVTDGTRLYFSEEAGGHSTLAQMSTAGGEVLPLRTPFEHAVLLNISPDGSELLVATPVGYEVESPLWAVPVLGGAPRRVGKVMAHDAAWLPDGQEIVYAHGQDLYLVNSEGSESRNRYHTRPRLLAALVARQSAFAFYSCQSRKQLTFAVGSCRRRNQSASRATRLERATSRMLR